jgi:hypothetical protein
MEREPSESMPVAELGRQLLRVAKMTKLGVGLTQGVERDAPIEVEVDLVLLALAGLRQMGRGGQRLLERRRGGAIGRPIERLGTRLAEIDDRLLPHLPADGMVGEPLDVLAPAIGREPSEGLGDAGVQRALPVVEQPLVGHLVREGVLEVRKEPGLVEELRSLEVGELGEHLGLRHVGDGQEERHGHVRADDRSGLEQPLGLRRQAVDACRQDRPARWPGSSRARRAG